VAEESPGLVIEEAYVSAPVVVGPAALYFTLRNATTVADTLLTIHTSAGVSISLHESAIDTQGRMGMSPRERIYVAPGQIVIFAPGGLHGMIPGTAPVLRAGDSLSVEFRFSLAPPIVMTVPVRPPGG